LLGVLVVALAWKQLVTPGGVVLTVGSGTECCTRQQDTTVISRVSQQINCIVRRKTARRHASWTIRL